MTIALVNCFLNYEFNVGISLSVDQQNTQLVEYSEHFLKVMVWTCAGLIFCETGKQMQQDSHLQLPISAT